MLTLEGCRSRRARVWNGVPESVEWLLVADPRHVHYLSNFLVSPLSFSAGERGLLLLERNGPATLIADNFTRRSASGPPRVDAEIIETWYDHRHSVASRDGILLKALQRAAEPLWHRRGLVENEWLPEAAYKLLEETGANPEPSSLGKPSYLGRLLHGLRRNKLADEIALIRQAIAATEAGHARAREVVRPGVSEFDVYREVHAAVLGAAGRPVTIYGDFRAVTEQVPKQGGPPTDYVLKPGDLFILDYSVVIDGYRSDFTNTICAGTPNDRQMHLFELCRAAMAAGESSLRPGAMARDVYSAVAGPFRDAGCAASFPHHAGHGIGLAHPESPILVAESDDILEAGDVVTLEPGLYVEGTGGVRIEHNYLITESGYERLSNHVLSLNPG